MPNAQFQVGREALVAETLEPVLAFTKLCEVWLSGKQVVPNCTNAPMHRCTNAPTEQSDPINLCACSATSTWESCNGNVTVM